MALKDTEEAIQATSATEAHVWRVKASSCRHQKSQNSNPPSGTTEEHLTAPCRCWASTSVLLSPRRSPCATPARQHCKR